MSLRPPTSTLFPYTTLFRSLQIVDMLLPEARLAKPREGPREGRVRPAFGNPGGVVEHAYRAQGFHQRSEEHTSELQSLRHLVCRLLLEKKKQIPTKTSKTGD